MLCNSAAGSWPAYARTRDGKTPLVSAYYVYDTIYSRLCMVYAHGWIKEPLLMTGFSSRLLLCGQRDRIIDRLFDDSMCVVFSFIFFFRFVRLFIYSKATPPSFLLFFFIFLPHLEATTAQQYETTHVYIYKVLNNNNNKMKRRRRKKTNIITGQ